jgi:hypothetical protein
LVVKKYIMDAVQIDSLEVQNIGEVTVGLRVRHPYFGVGTVKGVFRFPDDKHAIGVEFDSTYGYKALAPEYAKLQLAKEAKASIIKRLFGKKGQA